MNVSTAKCLQTTYANRILAAQVHERNLGDVFARGSRRELVAVRSAGDNSRGPASGAQESRHRHRARVLRNNAGKGRSVERSDDNRVLPEHDCRLQGARSRGAVVAEALVLVHDGRHCNSFW